MVVVGGVVTVGARCEQRAERETGGAEFDRVVEPVDDPAHPVLVGSRGRVGREGADESQRIDLPPDHVFDPVRFGNMPANILFVERSSSVMAVGTNLVARGRRSVDDVPGATG